MDDVNRIQSILHSNLNMILSTADKNGTPWITPVAYTFDKDNSLYWVSSKNSRHSANVRARKEIAIVIFMFEPAADAIYIEANAKELVNESEILLAINVVNTRTPPERYRVKGLSDVSGQAEWRIYKAVSKAMYVRAGAMVGSQAVTVRRKIA